MVLGHNPGRVGSRRLIESPKRKFGAFFYTDFLNGRITDLERPGHGLERMEGLRGCCYSPCWCYHQQETVWSPCWYFHQQAIEHIPCWCFEADKELFIRHENWLKGICSPMPIRDLLYSRSASGHRPKGKYWFIRNHWAMLRLANHSTAAA